MTLYHPYLQTGGLTYTTGCSSTSSASYTYDWCDCTTSDDGWHKVTPTTWYKIPADNYTVAWDGALTKQAMDYARQKLRDWTWSGTANYTFNSTGWSTTCNNWTLLTPEDPVETRRRKLRDAMRLRSRAFGIRTGKRPVGTSGDLREQRARDTLRSLIGERKYRLFLTSGFISVKSPRSGLVYQIFPGHGITRVYDRGRLAERLCVVLKGDFPPTDSLIVRYLMILNNEQDFRARAVLHGVKGLGQDSQPAPDWRSLPEIAADYQGRKLLVG